MQAQHDKGLDYRIATSSLGGETINESTEKAIGELDPNDQLIIQYNIRLLSSQLPGCGTASVRELLSRIGLLFADNPDALERLIERR